MTSSAVDAQSLLLDQREGFRDIDPYGWVEVSANDVNGAGDIVGQYEVGFDAHGFLMSADGKATTFPWTIWPRWTKAVCSQ